MKITSAMITPMPRPMPEGMFSFFPDEISFQPSEFTELTEEEPRTLFQRKDIAYLRS